METCWRKIREDVVDGPSLVITRKAVVQETLIRKPTNICKSVVGIDASQLYPYPMCQIMPTGVCMHCDIDPEQIDSNFNKTRS